MTFSVTLPMPPSANAIWRWNGGQGVSKAPKYTAWINEAGWRMNEARAKGLWKPLAPDTWYWTDMLFSYAHKGDSDNRIKAIHDLLHSMGATPDDKWLMGGTYMRSHDLAPDMCQVTARSCPDGPPPGFVTWLPVVGAIR